MSLKTISFPREYNYCAVFLTLGCQLKCSYCINIQQYNRGELAKGRKTMTAKDWIEALNRIEARDDLPLSIQGGEPTSHKEFYEIINGVHRPMDLLTNCQFNLDEFMGNVTPDKFRRNAPYASIRVSYHPEQMDLLDTVSRVSRLHRAGYQVGVWMVEVPEQMHLAEDAAFAFAQVGVSFKVKELLGEHKGEVHGTFKYAGSVDAPKEQWQSCMCRTTEFLIAPDGSIHRCHSDIYNLREGIGHILDESFTLDREFRWCGVFGNCSGCDTKIKTNRFQEYGHTSVEIEKIGRVLPLRA